MDPAMQPINGISLERYAELGAVVADFMDDHARVAEAITKEGVALSDYEAAKAGWTARMQDMSLMGRVAMAYMPLFQAAVAKRKGGQAMASYEDFVAVSAAIKVYGFEVGIKACNVSMSDWTEVAAHWNRTMAADQMRYAGHFNLITQEEGRLRAGGQPKTPQITRVAGQVPAAPPPGANPYAAMMGADPNTVPANANPMDVAMQNRGVQQAMAQQQANANAIAANPLGFGLGQVANQLTGGIVPGSNVRVNWSDGNTYPAKVLQTGPDQAQVQFQNGSIQWIPNNALKMA